MWKNTQKPPIAEFLGWILFTSLLVQSVLMLLEPYSIAFVASIILWKITDKKERKF